jgi:hypothetical protein
MLSNLGNSYRMRFETVGSTDDLYQAVSMGQKAVAASPYDYSPIIFNNLGLSCTRLFDRTEDPNAADRAIQALEKSLMSASCRGPVKALCLHNLGRFFWARSRLTGSSDDATRSISVLEEALALTAHNDPSYSLRGHALTNVLYGRYQLIGSLEDLDKSIASGNQVVALTDIDEPDRSLYLIILAAALQSRFEETGNTDDLEAAIEKGEEAVSIVSARPSSRILAADAASKLLIGRDHQRANQLLRCAVGLLPLVAPRTLRQYDQQYNLSQFATIVARAASVSIDVDHNPYNAVRLLELGRGVLSSLQLQVRSDITTLKLSHPDLAERFEEVRALVDRSPSDGRGDSFGRLPDSDTRAIFTEFQNVLGSIRNLHGFENFLLGPTSNELKALAAFGPIIILNVSSLRSDAFLVDTEKIQCLPLPLLHEDDLITKVDLFLDAINSSLQNASQAKTNVKKILEWLWDVAVGPILGQLGFTQPPSNDSAWPRVWWVGGGLLSILPIHAAGYHDVSPRQCAIDLVISSYSPTAKSLVYAREMTKIDTIPSQTVMFVGMPKTPGQNDLPFVEAEFKQLRDLLPANIKIMKITGPTRDEVMTILPHHSIVHFACHGESLADPSQSRVLLEDWQTASLTVSDLTSLKILSPQFAYLSACHSASIRDGALLEESIHLSSAIQLAGYPSVVGTLWQVQDKYSAQVSEKLYSCMLQGEKLDTLRSAEGLHKAVRQLRDETRNVEGFSRKVSSNPLIWSPYVHIGV